MKKVQLSEREKSMKIIFATTNKRKTEDLENTIREINLDIEVLSMEDIGWDRGMLRLTNLE